MYGVEQADFVWKASSTTTWAPEQAATSTIYCLVCHVCSSAVHGMAWHLAASSNDFVVHAQAGPPLWSLIIRRGIGHDQGGGGPGAGDRGPNCGKRK